jgi:hypothetical protein
MLFPNEQIAISQARHEELLHEANIVRLLGTRPKQPSRIRHWTGSSMIWVGARLVDWGIGLELKNAAHSIEAVN